MRNSSKSAKAYLALTAKYSEKSVIDDYLCEVGDFAEVDYLGYKMPGSAKEKFHDWCGTWGVKGCLNHEEHPENKDYAKPYLKSCYRALCSVCKNPWLYREASTATKRIEKYEDFVNKPAKHLMWSPAPNNPIIHKSLKTLRKACYSAMKEVGIEGAAVIFHAYRNKVIKGSKQWYYSPHFHLVGFGWLEGTKKHYAKNNTVIVNLGTRQSVFATFVYQLSHCAIKKGRHSLTWIGSLSYSKLKMPDDEEGEEKCPYCNEKLVVLEICSGFDPPEKDFTEGLFEQGSFFRPGDKEMSREGIASYHDAYMVK